MNWAEASNRSTCILSCFMIIGSTEARCNIDESMYIFGATDKSQQSEQCQSNFEGVFFEHGANTYLLICLVLNPFHLTPSTTSEGRGRGNKAFGS
mmetsp:Transcript_19558/g.42162  ORF Transcript_19558/g.42162 Transcript_19558/m.42162 type:complete len:95 (-) Transcript_19558:30-314(-)